MVVYHLLRRLFSVIAALCFRTAYVIYCVEQRSRNVSFCPLNVPNATSWHRSLGNCDRPRSSQTDIPDRRRYRCRVVMEATTRRSGSYESELGSSIESENPPRIYDPDSFLTALGGWSDAFTYGTSER